MKLTNKVTNVFFAAIAVIALFMPIVGYATVFTGAEYNIVDMINFLKNAGSGSDATLLSNLGIYGYRDEAIVVAVFFVAMLVLLVATIVLSFVNVPYLVRTVTTGLGLGCYITAAVAFVKIGNAFVAGMIPTTAITSLGQGGEENVLSQLIASFASVQKMGLAPGAVVGIICFAILFLVNLVFFILRKRFAEADGKKEYGKKQKNK